MPGAFATFVASTTASAKWFFFLTSPLGQRASCPLKTASIYVARTPRSGSGSRRSSVSASSSIAPRIPYVSEKRARISSMCMIPALERRRAATARPSAGVCVTYVETGSDTRCTMFSAASTFTWISSGTPFAWCNARSASAAASAGMSRALTMRSAPEICAPSRAARIFTAKSLSSFMEVMPQRQIAPE